jgi:hypothetical protein
MFPKPMRSKEWSKAFNLVEFIIKSIKSGANLMEFFKLDA